MPPVDRMALLEQLRRLPRPIFDEVVFELGVNVAHLPGAEAPQSERAMALIQLLDIVPGGVEHLQAVVNRRVAASLGGASPRLGAMQAPMVSTFSGGGGRGGMPDSPPFAGAKAPIPRLSAADRATLRNALSDVIKTPQGLREVIGDADLSEAAIDLTGPISSQWHNTLDYADRQGATAQRQLLTSAVFYGPSLWERVGELLKKYGVHSDDSPPPQQQHTVIIFASSMPREAVPLEIQAEFTKVQETLTSAKLGDQYRLVPALHLHPQDLGDLLRRHSSDPNSRLIFHFSGHATPAGLVMVNSEQRRVVVPTATLVGIFGQWSRLMDMVVLNACETIHVAEAVAAVVPHAIGTTQQFKDKSALVFSPVFYRALANGSDVASAFGEARLAVDAEGHGQGDTLRLLPELS